MTHKELNRRTLQKEHSHARILEVAARQFREDGLMGAGVQRIMEEAGLTHGGFYSHFDSKTQLIAEAMAKAVAGQRELLLAILGESPDSDALMRLVNSYLSREHRDAPGEGCPLPALSAEIARAPESVRRAVEKELHASFESVEKRISGGEDEKVHAHVVGALALCVGGLLLARVVNDSALSDDILQSCRRFAAEILKGDEE